MAKCPICGKNKTNKQDLINHVEKEHMNEISENMSTAQYIYYKTHGREYGLCRICGKATPWNEKTGKPQQHCGDPKCKEKIKDVARQRMLKVYGKESLMNDIKHQEKMLANRRISGTYLWSDGKHKFTYTGKYEKFAIEWLDKVMDLDPENIQMPGPILPYEFNGEIKYWITDIYLSDFNLIIEIKAGKDENTHPGFEHNRELEDAKDKSMLKQNVYNYTKITHKSMMNLIKVLTEIRMKNLFSEKENNINPIVVINESIDNNIEYPVYPKVESLLQKFKDFGCKIKYEKVNQSIKDNRHANGLYNPDEIFTISYDGEDFNSIYQILACSEHYECYEKPRMSKVPYCKYKLTEVNGAYMTDVYVDFIRKDITIHIFLHNNNNNSSIDNSKIESICESIMNEYTMSVANISPIVTSNAKYEDNDSLLSRLNKIKNMSKQETIIPQDNLFSPNNTQPAPNPLDASDNFQENNEEVIVDMESDPYNTKLNDFAEISQSNIKSYF